MGPGSSSSDGDGSTMQDAGQGGGFVYTKLSNPQRKQKKRRQPRSGAVELTKAELLERRIEIVESKKQWLSDEATRVGRSIRAFLQEAFPGTEQGVKTDDDDASSSDSFHTAGGPSSPTEVLCLGLGSVKDSRPAQLQLAFLLLVVDRFLAVTGQGALMQAYDPIWDAEDKELLAHFGIKSLSSNERGAYPISKDIPTLVYMPHCTQSLYEALLQTNWTPAQIGRLSLLSNDLSRYDCSSEESSCTVRFARHMEKIDVPTLLSPNNDALNDLALQRFVDVPLGAPSSSSLTDTLGRLSLNSTVAKHHDFWTLPHPLTDKDHDSEVI